ncbi:hypothetical protein LR48_Vigan01g097500 [Vigna angularis]|uniref:Uncharacterized protein n=1 Tax=Phaseolus angularis TaxID=3914 RepID=A0A0L9TLI1_PHAAN|nr:hypothetical protein LR48_Vigan01g097500 [Vigna angularis]
MSMSFDASSSRSIGVEIKVITKNRKDPSEEHVTWTDDDMFRKLMKLNGGRGKEDQGSLARSSNSRGKVPDLGGLESPFINMFKGVQKGLRDKGNGHKEKTKMVKDFANLQKKYEADKQARSEDKKAFEESKKKMKSWRTRCLDFEKKLNNDKKKL